MKLFRNLTLGLLTVAAVASCGRTNLTAPNAVQAASTLPTVKTASGDQFTLGFDMKKYKSQFAPKAKVQHLKRQGLLPASVDNRNFCPPVYNQGMLGACTAFSMGKGLREYLQRLNGEEQVPLSALYLYYEERVLNNTVNEDSGATMTQGMQVLKDKGDAPDADRPYGWTYLLTYKKPNTDKANTDAAKWKVANPVQLGGLDDIKTALAAKKPVVFGFVVYQTFMSAETQKTGKMEMPQPQQGERQVGGHAVMACGYDDERKVLIMRNSWSEKWGDKGYFYMPYEYVQNKEWVDDIWTVN